MKTFLTYLEQQEVTVADINLINESLNQEWTEELENKIVNKFASVIDFKLVNNEINIYSTNGYLLSFKTINGNLNYSGRLNKKGILSEIFFLNDGQKETAKKVLGMIDQNLSGKVVTNISLVKNYCPAEEYHQRYLEKR